MKQTLIILLIVICFFGCKDDFIVDNSLVNSLKVYDFDVQRVKKIHNLFALIDTSTVLFLDDKGENVFDFKNVEYKQEETISFKFTDVVVGSNTDIFIIGAEILKDKTLQIYVFKVNERGQQIWDNPIIIPISNDFIKELNEKFYFFISHNGYALGCFNNNKLFLVVNYESAANKGNMSYKLFALDDAGSILKESMPMQESHPEIWNYMIEPLPDGNLITSLAVGYGAAIHQFDSNTFELKQTSIILASDIQARLPIFTNMLHLNNEEVIFTGHANKGNNRIVGGNFDAFFVEYNTIDNTIANTLFSGANSSYELTFHSFIDDNGNIKCIGTKREDLFISHGINSNLFEIDYNLNSNLIDSLFIFQNKGYEGLYFEPVGNSGLLKILGSKLDISGKQNKQAFFTILKP
ncbi:MAG TPA: hypothetical protein PLC80_10365 [Draconibacterium sp.]|nr:hypothetical protein [Draconibacterium sp.]